MGYNTSESRGADTFHPFSSGKKVYSLGSCNSGTTFDIKTLCPDEDYTKLTNENFKVLSPTYNSGAVVNYISGRFQDILSYMYASSVSYNATTGILTASAPYAVGGCQATPGGTTYMGYNAVCLCEVLLII